MMRIETIGEQEVDRTRAIIRFALRRSGGGLRNMGENGDRNYRADKYCNCVSDSRSHKGGLLKSVEVYGVSRRMLSFSETRMHSHSRATNAADEWSPFCGG